MEQSGPTSSGSTFSAEGTTSYWPKAAFPLNLKVGSNFSGDEYNSILNASASWSTAIDNQIEFFDLSPSNISELAKSSNYEDNELGIYKLNTWPEDMPRTALAVTQIFGKENGNGTIKIDHADILINYENFTFSTDDSWGYDFESIVLHELGHFLGLFHNNISSSESVMYPSISKYNTNRFPKPADTQDITTLYSLTRVQAADVKSFNSSIKNENKRIKLILELYPDGSEKVHLKKGEFNESFYHNCQHNHGK